MIKCPNCKKELRWIPKGKVTCSCGEIIISDGKDLQELGLPDENKNSFTDRFEDSLPSFAEVIMILSVLLTIVLLIARVIYQKKWLQYESGVVFNIFGTDPIVYKEIIVPCSIITFCITWIVYKIIKKLWKN